MKIWHAYKNQPLLFRYTIGSIIGTFLFCGAAFLCANISPLGAQASGTLPNVNGNCNNFGNNNFNCNTFNFGPSPLRFTDKFAEDMLSRMPVKKKVRIDVIGPSQETFNFGAQMTTFLQNKGYDAELTYNSQIVPMPKQGITFQDGGISYIWTIVH
jgi:hypothetical protein